MYRVPDNILYEKICGTLIYSQTFKNLTVIRHFSMASQDSYLLEIKMSWIFLDLTGER